MRSSMVVMTRSTWLVAGLGRAGHKVMEHAAAENRRRAEELASVLLANLDEIADDLHSGALVVIGEERIRIRRLPV